MRSFKVRLLRDYMIRGTPHAAGSVLDAGPLLANDLRNEAAGELCDPREAPGLREAVHECYRAQAAEAARSARAVGFVSAGFTPRSDDYGPWRPVRY